MNPVTIRRVCAGVLAALVVGGAVTAASTPSSARAAAVLQNGPAQVAAVAPAPATTLYYQIRARHSGKCLDFWVTNRITGLSLCIIGDLTFSAVPLVSDAETSSCDKRFRLVPVTAG
jgi:hypothetical protein